MTRIITDDEFVKAFDAAVEERGREFVYPQEWRVPMPTFEGSDSTTCLYNLEDGAPACVFGLAFHKLGLAPAAGVVTDILDMTSTLARDEFEAFEGDPSFEDALSWRERADVEFNLSVSVRGAAQRAQDTQDSGLTWGEASEVFHRFLDGEAPGAD